jgi:hypothetical protein
MKPIRSLFFSILAMNLIVYGQNYYVDKNLNVDKLSPTGEYRVKVDIHVEEENDLAGHFNERGKIQVFKGKEVIYSNEWKVRDNWESTFIDNNPIIEWVGDNALRMGRDRSKESVSNQLVISNNTDERLKHMGVSCGKSENFYIFSLPPNSQLTLYPSPGLNPDTSKNYLLGYGGETQSGKKFYGVLEKRKPPAGKSVRLEISVSTKDLRSQG